MNVELITTGTELLLGNVTNTHLTFLGQELFPHGLRIARQVCVPDGPPIRDALLESFARADIVLVTGGLGPTSDDLTRDLTAELLGRPLAEDAAVLADLQSYFTRVNRPMKPSIARQAQVPAGAVVIENHHGTAPGLYLPPGPFPRDVDAGQTRLSPHLFLLPGPPREMRPMFLDQVVPRLRELLPPDLVALGCRIYRTVSLGESQVEALVGPELEAIEGLEIGYCARLGEVDLRCIGTAAQLDRAEAIVLRELSDYLLSRAGESLEQVLVHRLGDAGCTLATVESCTGGLLANRVTNVAGSSAIFLAGWVTYSDQAKTRLLGVDVGLISDHGAVSEAVARAMASGARRTAGTDFALATTGEAGPESGGGQPVGTLFVALAGPGDAEPIVEKHLMPTDRESFKQRASQAALDLLRRHLAK